MTGKYMLDVFGGVGPLAKATDLLGLRGYVLDTKLGCRYDVTKPIVLTRIRQDVSAGMIQPPPHFVLSPTDFRQCCHRKPSSRCSHALDSGTPV